MIKLGQVCALAMIAPIACAASPSIHAGPSGNWRIAPAATLVQMRGPGAPCVADGQCRSFKCEPSLDIYWYCVEEGAQCAMKGSGGVKVGRTINANNQCYECKQGMGWQLCASPPAAKRRQTPSEMPNATQDSESSPRVLRPVSP